MRFTELYIHKGYIMAMSLMKYSLKPQLLNSQANCKYLSSYSLLTRSTYPECRWMISQSLLFLEKLCWPPFAHLSLLNATSATSETSALPRILPGSPINFFPMVILSPYNWSLEQLQLRGKRSDSAGGEQLICVRLSYTLQQSPSINAPLPPFTKFKFEGGGNTVVKVMYSLKEHY